ncbi:MAG: SURF1 family protein [Nocardioides sp.]|nr:SURF1 family protein [Nocardioides sp.]
MGFLLSRRWVLFALTVGLLVWLAVELGQWQFDRQTDREDRNAITEVNLSADPAPVAEVLTPGREVDPQDEWRRVEATGTYAEDDTIVIRYRTRGGASGIDVVTPLVTEDGPALLVDRGWLATDNRGIDSLDLPDAPSGEVTVLGWVRADATGSSTQVENSSARAISSEAIGPTLDYPVYGGFVDLVSESPEATEPLSLAEPPDLGEGPHFFYGLQWWFFAALALFGFGYLAFDERRAARRGEDPRRRRGARAQRARSMPPSTGSMAPVTKDAAGESRKAAARPNSSGRP